MHLILFFSILFCSSAFSQSETNNTNRNKKTIIENNSDFTPLQMLKGDTLNGRRKTDSPNLPGKTGEYFSPEQDSNYYRAMKLKISANARFRADMKQFERILIADRELAAGTPMNIAMKNMMIPSDIFVPLAADVTAHEYGQIMATSVPFVKTYNPYSGFKISLNTIGRFLGLVEDLSPNLAYKIDYAADVQIVIYSLQAVVIATIFDGPQQPGSYKFTWNLRDDAGRKMPSGDYIGEIRIGKERYVRKRIYIP